MRSFDILAAFITRLQAEAEIGKPLNFDGVATLILDSPSDWEEEGSISGPQISCFLGADKLIEQLGAFEEHRRVEISFDIRVPGTDIADIRAQLGSILDFICPLIANPLNKDQWPLVDVITLQEMKADSAAGDQKELSMMVEIEAEYTTRTSTYS